MTSSSGSEASPGKAGRLGRLERSSRLAAPAEAVWEHAMSPQGVNRELRPFLRMTFPEDVASLGESWVPGRRLFRSWILLFGVLPVEYDDLSFAEIEPGRRFLERSTLLTQSLWEHERVIEPTANGCRLTDRVRFAPRIGLLTPLCSVIFAAVFAWRHRNLRALFGGEAG